MRNERLKGFVGLYLHRRGKVLGLIVVAWLLLPGVAEAAPLWSWAPSPFGCSAKSNGCVSSTGFNPNISYWGAYTNTRGNCTNYASYRLQRNGARQFSAPTGNAAQWAGNVRRSLGSSRVNGTPKVGSIAWWSGSHPQFGYGGAGHVAYVEKVSKGTVYLTDSRWNSGSSRWTVTSKSKYWPSSFLHIKDAPTAAPPPPPPPPPASSWERIPGNGRLVQLDWGGSGELWGVSSGGIVYKYAGNGAWTSLGGGFKQVSVGPAGSGFAAYAIRTDTSMMRYRR